MDDTRQTNLTIRRAERADLAGIIALDEVVTGESKPEYWLDIFERFGERRPTERHFLIAEADKGSKRFLGAIVGEVRAWEFGSPPCGWVFSIQVVQSERQGGVGTHLLEALCGAFREAGVTKLRTVISRDNLLLMSFFRSQGMMGGPYLQLEMDLASDGPAP